jgi:hypothetical protein
MVSRRGGGEAQYAKSTKTPRGADKTSLSLFAAFLTLLGVFAQLFKE